MIVTKKITERTFRLKWGTSEGTCFTIDFDDRQYIVTAKHIISSITDCATVQIQREKRWKDLPVRLVGHGRDGVDVSVLAAKSQFSPAHPLHTTSNGLKLSQDVYFLGFPYGLTSEMGAMNRDFPIPLVKKGIVSALYVEDSGPKRLFLDGHNNPGFSGGPVVCHRSSDQEGELTVVGIVSGYRGEREPVYHEQDLTPLSYIYNTGIVVAHYIDHAVELIRQNPIGVKLKTGTE